MPETGSPDLSKEILPHQPDHNSLPSHEPLSLEPSPELQQLLQLVEEMREKNNRKNQ